MGSIALNNRWQLGDELAKGGFGRVYSAKDSDGTSVVVKLIPKEPGAGRELLFEDLPRDAPHVMPILDTGEWQDHYFLVMPRAEKSLREHLEEHAGRLSVEEATAVLIDVAEALAAIEGTVVHRDLKPENVLLFQAAWCLADFGIARYTEAATATDTHKYSMTPAYAAPEQWKHERASSGTDVYALGVMGFEMLEGALPFVGPTASDFRDQHLSQAPPRLIVHAPLMVSLVQECLYKAAGARPKPRRILERLRTVDARVSPAAARLQTINSTLVDEASRAEAALSAKRQVEEARKLLSQTAAQALSQVLDELRDSVIRSAPSVEVAGQGALTLKLGNGLLTISGMQNLPQGSLAMRGETSPFDVVAFTAIHAIQPADYYRYQGRAHSLWFCDAEEEGFFRWYELAFMITPGMREQSDLDPFALPPTDDGAAEAFSSAIDIRQVAWGPMALDQGQEEQFIERWMGWFSEVAAGTLSHPRTMPEQPIRGWRRAKEV